MILIEKGAQKNLSVKNVLPLEAAIKKRASYMNNLDAQEAKENFMIIELLAAGPVDVYLNNVNGLCGYDFAVMGSHTDVIEHFYSISCDLYSKKNKISKFPIEYAGEGDYKKFLQEKFPPP